VKINTVTRKSMDLKISSFQPFERIRKAVKYE